MNFATGRKELSTEKRVTRRASVGLACGSRQLYLCGPRPVTMTISRLKGQQQVATPPAVAGLSLNHTTECQEGSTVGVPLPANLGILSPPWARNKSQDSALSWEATRGLKWAPETPTPLFPTNVHFISSLVLLVHQKKIFA